MKAKPENPEIKTLATQNHELHLTPRYMNRLVQFLKKHPDLKAQYFKTIALLEANPFHPSLRLHAVSGQLAGLHSVSINLSYRITLEFLIEGKTITPINVGDHDAVY